MKRKAFTVGFLAMALTITAVSTPLYSRFVASSHSFKEYFQDLDQAGNSLNPLERFVFSLVLANSKTAPNNK